MDLEKSFFAFKQLVDEAFALEDQPARATKLLEARAVMMGVKPEERAALWVKITAGCAADDPVQLDYVKMCHAAFADVILAVFGVPMGERGANVKPKRGVMKKVTECITKNRSN